MPFAGVLFDLFGTLVPPFPMREHVEVVRRCAERLEIPYEEFHPRWVDLYGRRVRGGFASIHDNLAYIVREAGRRASAARTEEAAGMFEAFTRAALVPLPGAADLLASLRGQGVRLGLVSNCGPDVPRVWPSTALASHFDACAFSCVVGAMKPEPELYLHALNALRLRAGETLFVGDGSDQELSGAQRCGLRPVLARADLSNTYDAHRPEVEAWNGLAIHTLSELPRLMAGL